MQISDHFLAHNTSFKIMANIIHHDLFLSGVKCLIRLVFFVLKSLLGIARCEKFAIFNLSLKPRSHVRILIYLNVGYSIM